jgi:hypothetical protein
VSQSERMCLPGYLAITEDNLSSAVCSGTDIASNRLIHAFVGELDFLFKDSPGIVLMMSNYSGLNIWIKQAGIKYE